MNIYYFESIACTTSNSLIYAVVPQVDYDVMRWSQQVVRVGGCAPSRLYTRVGSDIQATRERVTHILTVTPGATAACLLACLLWLLHYITPSYSTRARHVPKEVNYHCSARKKKS